MQKVNIAEKLSLITDHWKPRIVGTLNGQDVKLVKFRGTFVWHAHEEEDELFYCLSGRVRIELRERSVEIGPGEMFIVLKGTEHRTSADEESDVLIFEPVGTSNTGNVEDAALTAVASRI